MHVIELLAAIIWTAICFLELIILPVRQKCKAHLVCSHEIIMYIVQ